MSSAGPLDGRLPPQNLEAEKQLLDAMLFDNGVIDAARECVDAGDFYRDSHRVIAESIFDLRDQGKPVDLLTIEEDLNRRGVFERIGGLGTLLEISGSAPHSVNAVYHAQIVREKSLVRKLIDFSNTLLRDSYSNTKSAGDLLQDAERQVYGISEGLNKGDLDRISKFAVKAMDRVACRQEGEYSGVASGFAAIDSLVDGFANQSLVVLAARPSVGKTALALNIAENAAMNAGVATLFVSLEMSGVELAERFLVGRSGVPGHKVRTCRGLSTIEFERMGMAYDESKDARIWIDPSPVLNVSRIAGVARRLKSKERLGFVIVDYLQLVSPGGGTERESRQEQVAKMSRGFKTLARELNLPILLLSQLNREVEKREDRRPRMADLRESGAIEQDSDIVILLHRPELFDPNDSPGVAELNIAKNRNGPTGRVKLTYDKSITRFREYVEMPGGAYVPPINGDADF